MYSELLKTKDTYHWRECRIMLFRETLGVQGLQGRSVKWVDCQVLVL